MPNQPQLYNRLQHVQDLATQRLDRMSELLPPVKQRVPFEVYLMQAQTRAASDPQFAQRFEQARRQYEALGGRIRNGTT